MQISTNAMPLYLVGLNEPAGKPLKLVPGPDDFRNINIGKNYEGQTVFLEPRHSDLIPSLSPDCCPHLLQKGVCLWRASQKGADLFGHVTDFGGIVTAEGLAHIEEISSELDARDIDTVCRG